MSAPGAVGVVIPACGEDLVIGACLWSLLTQDGAPRMRVVVALNGGRDRTADVVAAYRPLAAAQHHELEIVDTAGRGKPAALDAGEAALGDHAGIRIFLDADVVLSAHAVSGLIAALAGPQPRLAGLTPAIYETPARSVRSFFRVWSHLPSVRDQVVGGGVYAVNGVGRGRWDRFPALLPDDAFVRSRFADRERVLREESFLLVPPRDSRQMRETIRRWRDLNRRLSALDAADGVSARPADHLRKLARTPAVWAHLPSFVFHSLSARAMSRRTATRPWEHPPRASREARRREGAELARIPRVHAVVVTHNSERHIGACLRALMDDTAGALLTVTVVDNGSHDETLPLVKRLFPHVDALQMGDNLGFSRAANHGAARQRSDVDWLLFLNPDAMLMPGALRSLVGVAERLPNAGLYGPRTRGESGAVDHSSCLAMPSVAQALAYALCLHRFGPLRRLDPDELGGWRRDSVRHVPALTAAALLVDTRLWARLHGFDERFIHYGEDVDLCLRARELGADPLFSHLSEVMHVGGAGLEPGLREIMILRGKAELYRRRLPSASARLAIHALELGMIARAALSRGAERRRWSTVVSSRRVWRDGFASGQFAATEVRTAGAP
jgi:GT2 family glycosyltransferase